MTMRFSASRIQTFMNCQMQAKFKYVDKIPDDRVHASAVYGSAMHLALEKFNSGEMDQKKIDKFFQAVWNEPTKYGLEEPNLWPPRQTHDFYKKRGRESLKKYMDSVDWRDRTVLATEHPFLVKMGEFELTGYVDHIERTKDKKGREVLLLEDHKTATKSPSLLSLAGNIQFTVYDWASRQPEFWFGVEGDPDFPAMENAEWHYEMSKTLPRLNIWHGVSNGKHISAGERDQKDFDRLYLALTEMQRAVDKEVFVPDISGETCGFCPYTVECGLPVHEDVGEHW